MSTSPPTPAATDPAAYGHWIGGAEVEPADGRRRDSCPPGTDQVLYRVADGTAPDVERAVAAARDAGRAWRDRKPSERGRLLAAIATRIRDEAGRLADLEAVDAGKPAWQAPMEVEGSAKYFDFYAGMAGMPVGDTIALGADYHCYTVREPYGVVGVITPWNAPLNQAARAIAPALAAGNTVVAKPSEFTSATTLELARIATEEGLPPGVLNVVTGAGESVGRAIVENPHVRKVAFTGSIRAGREIGHIAADRILPLTLELGGKSANIIFDDADLEAAVRGAVFAFTGNAGQVCTAASRLLVMSTVYDDVIRSLTDAVGALRAGVEFGSLTTEAQFEKVTQYFSVAARDGATLAVGGTATDGPGWFVQPTVYLDVTKSMRIAREEIFGPVLSVLRFDDEDEAIDLANDTDYGLAAGVWTSDLSRAHRIASRLEAGQVYVNEWQVGTVETPFGGYKQSGYGREKGLEALHHYTQLKCITIKI